MVDCEGQMINAQLNAKCKVQNAKLRRAWVENDKLCPPLLCAFARSMFFLPSLKGRVAPEG